MDNVVIIAEAGVNHNGCIDRAKAMIDAAKQSQVDYIKFQTFNAHQLVTAAAPKAHYQCKNTNANETQREMLLQLQLSPQAHMELVEHCHKQKIQFLSTPFDSQSAAFLIHELGLTTLKVSSCDVTNAPFLHELARSGVKLILSTGMASLGEIEIALSVLAHGYLHTNEPPSRLAFDSAYNSAEGQKILVQNVKLLHCTTQYPAAFANVNLRAMNTLATTFGLPVGYSDHTEGLAVAVAAVARGACIIEKHFTLDKTLPGPDHKASIEPNELTTMVKYIRQIESALGSERKLVGQDERANSDAARKSLVCATDIREGDRFNQHNLTIKRPGNGLAPIHYWDMLATVATKNYLADEVIS